MRALATITVFLSLLSFPAFAECTEETQTQAQLDHFFKSYPAGIKHRDRFSHSILKDLEATLRPGDILIHLRSFDEKREDTGSDVATGGMGHSSIVAANEKGERFLYSLPQLVSEPNLGLKVTFPVMVVRPKTPAGKTREQFEQDISKVARALFEVKPSFDPFLSPEFLKSNFPKIRQAIDEGRLEKTDISPMYCSAVTQFMIAVAGGKMAKPTSAKEQIYRGMEDLREDYTSGKITFEQAMEKLGERIDEITQRAAWQKTADDLRAEIAALEKSLNPMDETQKKLLQQKKDRLDSTLSTMRTIKVADVMVTLYGYERIKGQAGMVTPLLIPFRF